MIVPEPPSVLTPPTTAAAIAASSRPEPAVTLIVPNRPTYRNPASPASAPHATKAAIWMRRVASPAWRAASGLEPSAYRWRPARVYCSTRWSDDDDDERERRTSCAPRSRPIVNTVLRGRSTSHVGQLAGGDRLAAGVAGQHAAEDRQRAERDDDRRHPGDGDEHAVDEAEDARRSPTANATATSGGQVRVARRAARR